MDACIQFDGVVPLLGVLSVKLCSKWLGVVLRSGAPPHLVQTEVNLFCTPSRGKAITPSHGSQHTLTWKLHFPINKIHWEVIKLIGRTLSTLYLHIYLHFIYALSTVVFYLFRLVITNFPM